ncbi:MAG: hypothetical protein FWH26_05040, partial [Oscillospiraceae bacterium]|nr:hypothetical protein [Oscillospiraceae bacterium]
QGTTTGWAYSQMEYIVRVSVPYGNGSVTYDVRSRNGSTGGWTPTGDTWGPYTTGSVAFINTYTSYTAEVPVTKTLIGTPEAAQSFAFRLTYTNESGVSQALPAGVTINSASSSPQTMIKPMTAPGSVPFEFELAGLIAGETYYFTLEEPTGGSGGPGVWSNDLTQYLIEVKIGTDGTPAYRYQSREGTTPAWGTNWMAGLPAAPTFSNTYTAPATVLLKAVKNTTGAPMTANQFSFALYEFETNGLLKSLPLQTAKNAGAGESGSVIFLPLTFTEEKEYVYYLTEVGDEPGWIMDSTRYRIYINVEDDGNGVLTAEVTYIEADDDGQEIAGRTLRAYKEADFEFWPDFTNTYAGPAFPEVGGPGNQVFFTAGITLAALLSVLFSGTQIRKSRKRRRLLAQ